MFIIMLDWDIFLLNMDLCLLTNTCIMINISLIVDVFLHILLKLVVNELWSNERHCGNVDSLLNFLVWLHDTIHILKETLQVSVF